MEAIHENGPRLIFKGLMILFILAGLAIFVSTVISAVRGTATGFMLGWNLVWNIIGILVAIWILSWIFRHLFWCGHGHGNHNRWFFDEREIARARYAKGEISRKQYMEIIKDLKDTKD